MAHAQVLIGDEDAVLSRAYFLAKAANCLTHESTPCGICASCKLFDANNHPDVFFVSKSKQTGIGVDDVRDQIITPMSTKPFAHRYKIFIINKADTLTHAAQSALLKTIEEPAPYGLFLFLAPHVHNFLPTVLSRCYIHKLGAGKHDNHNPELEALATEMADAKFDVLGAFKHYRKFEPYKESKETLQKLLDLIYHAYGKKISINKHQPRQEWLNAISAISRTKNILSQNGNMQLALELMLIQMSSQAASPS